MSKEIIKYMVKQYIWLIACDVICLFTGIVLIATSMKSQEIVIGGILVGLSWIGAHWIGLREGKEVAKKREEQS